MGYEELMAQFAPYIFVLIGVVIAFSLYKFLSDNDLRVFLMLNTIIQFILGVTTLNTICIIIAILSLIPIFLTKREEG